MCHAASVVNDNLIVIQWRNVDIEVNRVINVIYHQTHKAHQQRSSLADETLEHDEITFIQWSLKVAQLVETGGRVRFSVESLEIFK